jgi:hypothetical protein
MNLNKIIILGIGILLFSGTSSYAQQGPVATGGDATGAGGNASYSVGQVDYVTLEGLGGSSYLGLQQPKEFFTSSILEIGSIGLNAFVFPNPSSGEVTLSVLNAESSKMNFALYNTQGQLMDKGPLNGNYTRIDLNSMAAGAYVIRLTIDNKEIKIFKIIKQ